MSGLVKKAHWTGAHSTAISNHDLISNLHEALDQLSQKEKLAIHLRYWGPKSIAEIAKQLRISWDTSYELVNGAENKLRENLTSVTLPNLQSPQSPFTLRRQIETTNQKY